MPSTRSIAYRGIVAAMALVAVLAVGCGSPKQIELDAQDDGSQVEIQQDQTLVITLDSNPSTGYGWERTESADDVLQQLGEAEFKQRPQARLRVGAAGQQILRFKAQKAGQTKLELVYRRSWEKDVKPEKTFTVQVTVR